MRVPAILSPRAAAQAIAQANVARASDAKAAGDMDADFEARIAALEASPGGGGGYDEVLGLIGWNYG